MQVKTVTPSDINLFPDTDWIIGNHSDELTPWIPVMALRSSYKSRFFLLPCCAYNFDGSKYQRKNSSKSQYTEYLQYIKNLCIECGFDIEVDRLKIPSTKRICLIGRRRNYALEEHVKYCNIVKSIINSGDLVENKICWSTNFKARDSVEKVRNCTQIDKYLIDCIVNKITQYLLNDCSAQGTWSAGRTATIYELVKLIPIEMLKKLKTECGGLQTLLRNNHHIFKVQCGKVKVRYPKTVNEVNNNNIKNKPLMNIKKKPCWFYNNHPQGCPLTDDNCSFKHIHI